MRTKAAFGKSMLALTVALMIGLSVMGCSSIATTEESSTTTSEKKQDQKADTPTIIKTSPDKYTWYIKDYTGMNAATVGYTALDTRRHDRYGSGNVILTYIADDGTYLNPEDEDLLKEYVIYDQNIDPNTEIKLSFQHDSAGEEYDSLISSQNYEEVSLAVHRVAEPSGNATGMTFIDPSPDKYTRIVRDYVGRNLAACGYLSMAGRLTDAYGNGYVTLAVVTDDGSYVDPEDKDALSGYVVTGQDVTANTPISMTFSSNSDGEEYESLVSMQSINSINLTVSKIEP